MALSTKPTDTSPYQAPSAFSSHRRRRVRLHIPAALAWVSGGPCWAAGRQEKANQNLNIYIGMHHIVPGGAEPDCGVVLLFPPPPPFEGRRSWRAYTTWLPQDFCVTPQPQILPITTCPDFCFPPHPPKAFALYFYCGLSGGMRAKEVRAKQQLPKPLE